ncbi:MAG TPA: PepSY domain-containing protein [Hyphomicrobium sp.]|nr:PepSY domain-containing protein [Hyphomicrobium sp.]
MIKTSLLAAAAAVALIATPAFADEKPSADETAKLEAAATAYGFTGGQPEKESEATGVYELNDAKSKDGGQYDLKFDKDFKLLSITRD